MVIFFLNFSFFVAIERKTKSSICEAPIDLGFIMDSSGSLRSEYHKEKQFLNEVAESFGLSQGGTRAGVVTFSFSAEHSIKLNDHYNVSSFKDSVDAIPLMGRTTRIDRALQLAYDQMFTIRNGGRIGAPKVLILLTDGSQTASADAEDPAEIASDIRASGIRLIVVGIGEGVDKQELLKIGDGRDNVYTAESFDQLIEGDFIKSITTKSCKTATSLIKVKDDSLCEG